MQSSMRFWVAEPWSILLTFKSLSAGVGAETVSLKSVFGCEVHLRAKQPSSAGCDLF